MALKADIVGAGIGGLASAVALASSDVQVRVFEQADTLGEVGAGVQLSPNAMRVLRRMGLEDRIARAGFAPHGAVIRDGRSGRRRLNAPLGDACTRRYGAPYLNIHRADLHAILLEQAVAAGVELVTAARVDGYRVDGALARLRLDAAEAEAADIIVGADGIKSAIREQMLGPDAPDFTGNVAWRGLVPAASAPNGLIPPDATVWSGPGRHFVTYYVRGGELINFVAVEERSNWRKENWNEPGDLADLRAAFHGWRPEVTALLDRAEHCFLWALFDRKPLARWSDGPVALLGDACHPMPPFMAQGAAMALEDAFVLAQCILAGDDVGRALRRYEEIRKPRASRVQAQARANADLFHMNGVAARAKLMAMPFLPSALALKPLDWLYGFDPTEEPEGRGWT